MVSPTSSASKRLKCLSRCAEMSAYPGEPGNAVISAHRDRHFNRLEALDVGDTTVTESGTHRDSWLVVSKRVVDKDARVLFSTPDATLTLTTCWPIRYLGP